MRHISFIFSLTLLTLNICQCQQNATFRLEVQDMVISEQVPRHNQTIDSEMECYMKCLGDKAHCCLVEMKNVSKDKILCLYYALPLEKVTLTKEKHTKVFSVTNNNCATESCLAWYNAGYKKDGVYQIEIAGTIRQVFCDMTTDGGGWTVFQRRFDGSISFANRMWDDYKNGFGNAEGEYWLGNEAVHHLTTQNGIDTVIRIEATTFDGETRFIESKGFWIENETNRYRLHAGTLIAGDGEVYTDWVTHNNNFFSTILHDHDTYAEGNCAQIYSSGWWFHICFKVNLNGLYSHTHSTCTRHNILYLERFL